MKRSPARGQLALLASIALVVSALPAHADDEDDPASSGDDRDGAKDGSAEKPAEDALDPAKGIEVARNEMGSLSISVYLMARYLNQLPADQTFVDHLGRERKVDTRNDIQAPHRVLVNLIGFMFDEKFRYAATLWTVNASNNVAIIGSLSYAFHRAFELHAGTGGNAGTRSLFGSHPYWLAPDRVMADEFFRPGFTLGAWALGEVLPGLFYKAMVGNNLSAINISAGEDTRALSYSGGIWWMPTTGEFGPRGGFGDFEDHEDLATRFGVSGVRSRENRFSQVDLGPENTQIRLADSLLLFEQGALADGVTVQTATFKLLAADAAIKYRGLFLMTEGYARVLDDFEASGPLPVDSLLDLGFYVQASYMVVPRLIEGYAATSFVFGDSDEGFDTSFDVLGGVNWFPFDTRASRVNAQAIYVHDSPASSFFGYYVGGQRGPTISIAWSLLF